VCKNLLPSVGSVLSPDTSFRQVVCKRLRQCISRCESAAPSADFALVPMTMLEESGVREYLQSVNETYACPLTVFWVLLGIISSHMHTLPADLHSGNLWHVVPFCHRPQEVISGYQRPKPSTTMKPEIAVWRYGLLQQSPTRSGWEPEQEVFVVLQAHTLITHG